MSEQKPRAILYIRRSSDQQHGSMPDQVRWGIDKAKHEGLDLRVSEQMLDEALKRGANEIGDFYLDDAMTGANLERSGLIRMQRRMREDPDIGVLLVWNRDRIARPDRAIDGMDIEHEIQSLGKWIIFNDGRVGPRDVGQETTGEDIKAFIDYEGARKLRVNLAKNVCRSRKPNVEGGYWNGGAPPHGFERVAINLITGHVDIVPPRERRSGRELKHAVRPGTDPESLQKLGVVRWIFLWYEEGYGINAIAGRLNSLGIPSPHAGRERKSNPVRGRWNAGTVRDILEQPLYAGLMAYGRAPEGSIVRFDRHLPDRYRSLRRDERGASTVKAKKTVLRDSSTWWLVSPAITYEPIVSEEVWRRCLDRLSERGKQGKQRGLPRAPDREKYPLRLVCADCGFRMSGTPVGPRMSYLCSSYTNSGGKECHHNFVERDIVVYYALAAIKRRIQAVQAEGALRDAVRSVIDETREKSSSVQLELQAKEAALRRAEALARKAYDTMLRVDDPLQAEHAKAAYEGLLREQRAAKHALAALREVSSLSTVDPEAEVDAVMAEFRDLDALVSKKKASNLRPFFDRLGAELLVTFERRDTGRRRNVPVRVELRLDPAPSPLDQPPGGPQDSRGMDRGRGARPSTPGGGDRPLRGDRTAGAAWERGGTLSAASSSHRSGWEPDLHRSAPAPRGRGVLSTRPGRRFQARARYPSSLLDRTPFTFASCPSGGGGYPSNQRSGEIETRSRTVAATVSKVVWIGRVLSGLVAFAFLMSAFMKLKGGDEIAQGMSHLGLPDALVKQLAMLEAACVALYVFPLTSVLGAVLLTGYLGGAICSHLRVGDPYYTQVLLGVAVWLALWLREERIRALLPLMVPGR